MLRKIVKFILIMILSWVLLLGGIAAVGYSYVTSENSAGKLVNTVGGVLNKEVNLPEEVASMTLLEYGQAILDMVGDISGTKVGDMENYIGMNLLSDSLEEVVGLDSDVTKSTAIGDLATTITSNVTLNTAVEKFGIGLPSMPIFSDEEFMDNPLSSAFSDLDKYPLDSFLKITYAEDATEENPASPVIMQKFGQYSLSYINTNSKDIIDTFTLSDLMTITESSPKLLRTLKDNPVATTYDADGNVTKLGISDALKVTPIKDLMNVGTSKIWNYLGDYTLETMGKAVDNMTLGDAITITEDSHPLLQALQGTKISKLGNAMVDAVNNLTYDELLDVSGMTNPAPILVALKDTKISNTSEKLNSLKVSDVYTSDVGIMSLVPGDTLLTNMPAVLLMNTMGEDVYTVNKLGLVTLDTSASSPAEKAYIYNATISEIINDFPSILNGSKSVADFTPQSVNYSSATLDSASIESLVLGGTLEEGATLKLTADTAIPAGEVFTTRFNIDTNGYVLTIGDGAKFDINGGYAYFKGNIVGSMGSEQTIQITDAISVPAFQVENVL